MFRSNVPASHLPEGWRPAQLSSIATVHGGGRLKLNKGHYTDAGARAYSAAGPDGFVTQIEGTASSVVLSSIGARCGKAFLTDGPWTTLANTQVIIPNPDIAIASFLHAILDDETYWNRSGSAQPFIKPSDVKGAWVPLPPLDEQRRIDEVLRSVDEAILLNGRTVDQAVVALSAAREHLTGQDGSETDWTLQPILDCFQLQRGHDLPIQSRMDGNVPVIASNGPVGFHDHAPILAPAVITGRSGTIGKVTYFDGPCWPLNTTLFVRDFKGNDPRFVYHFLSSFPLSQHATGTGVPTLNRNDVHAVEVRWPEPEEQSRRRQILDGLETACLSARAALEASRKLKATLARDLLSGRVRVPA